MAIRMRAAASQYYECLTFSPAYPFSMVAWVRPPNITGDHLVVGVWNGSATNQQHILYCAGSQAGDPVRVRSGTTAIASTTTGFVANVWQHVAGVFTSDTSRTVYLNAGSSATNTTSVTPTGLNTVWVGRYDDQDNPFIYYDIDVAHVGIYSAALSQGDIALLAAGVPCDGVCRHELMAYWPMTRGGVHQISCANEGGTRILYAGNSGGSLCDDPPLVRKEPRRRRVNAIAASGFIPYPRPRGLVGGSHYLSGGMA